MRASLLTWIAQHQFAIACALAAALLTARATGNRFKMRRARHLLRAVVRGTYGGATTEVLERVWDAAAGDARVRARADSTAAGTTAVADGALGWSDDEDALRQWARSS
jgi:ATP-dependent protease ClpP protease subunit